MKTKINIAKLFEEEPAQWGFRGDPYLWKELQAHFETVEIPESPEKLKALIVAAFEVATNLTLESERIYLKEVDHGGMSGGMISTVFWRETAIPLLLSRYENAKN